MVGAEDFKSTILIQNIHCHSCVVSIHDALDGLAIPPANIAVSIVDQQVNIWHNANIALQDIGKCLFNVGFELVNAVSISLQGEKVTELNVPSFQNENWLDVVAQACSGKSSSSAGASSDKILTIDTPQKGPIRRHIETCAACQADSSMAKKPSNIFHSGPRKSRKWPVSTQLASSIDLEKGLLEAESRDNGFSLQGLDELLTRDNSAKGGQAFDSSASLQAGQDNLIESERHETRVDDSNEAWAHDASERYKALLGINGMTCSACTSTVSSTLLGLPSVEAVDVALLTSSATVFFHGSTEDASTLVSSVEDLGFTCTLQKCNAILAEDTQSQINVADEPEDKLHEATLSIMGMTCGSCTATISQMLTNLLFVSVANVNLSTNSALVKYKGSERLPSIIETIESAGFECTVQSSRAIGNSNDHVQSTERSIELKIGGLFCPVCPRRVLDTLEDSYGSKVHVKQPPTLEAPLLVITYDPSPPNFTIRSIIKTIQDVDPSFSVTIYRPLSIEDRARRIQMRERHGLLARLLLSVICAIPTFLIGVVWMDLVPSSNPIRKYLEHPIWSGQVTRIDWALFICATPVMFVSASIFHKKALQEIKYLWRPSSKVPIWRRFCRFGSMNLLMSAGTSVAYFSSLAVLIMGALSPNTNETSAASSTTYFDSVVFLTMFILMGRYLEAYARSKTIESVTALGAMKPSEALLAPSFQEQQNYSESFAGQQAETIDVDLLEQGDIVIVRAGSSPPADGLIVQGETCFNESALTGESAPVSKSSCDRVYAGTINQGKVALVQTTNNAGSSMLDEIIKLVREGQARRAPVERLADIITGYFVPCITLIAIITFLAWFILGQSGLLPSQYRDTTRGGWAFWAVEFSIAVFVVACPCGIGLAAPTALFVGSGVAAKSGILVKGGGEAFQEASELDIVVLDKTGTITDGSEPSVADHKILPFDVADSSTILVLAGLLGKSSIHPVARAIAAFCHKEETVVFQQLESEEIAGRGIRASVQSGPNNQSDMSKYEVALGSEAFMETLLERPIDSESWLRKTCRWRSAGNSVSFFALRSKSNPDAPAAPFTVAAAFSVHDPIRPEAGNVVAALQKQGIHVYMLTGDSYTAASAVGTAIGIPLTNIMAGASPMEKEEKVKWLRDHGPRRAKTAFASTWRSWSVRKRILQSSKEIASSRRNVAMLGDGINDGPALSEATVGIAMGSGSDLSMSAAKFILLSTSHGRSSSPTSSLTGLLTLIDLSKVVFRRVKFNFAWALVYNVCMIPLAAGVLYPAITSTSSVQETGYPDAKLHITHWRLSPVWASLAMALSSVSVVTSSLLLRSGWPGVGFRKRAIRP